MGLTTSSLESLKSNTCLQKFASKNHVSADDDKFWNDLLSISMSTSLKTSDHYKQVENSISLLLDQFLSNNVSSKNLGSLIRVLSLRVFQLRSFASQEASGFKVVTSNLVLVQALNGEIILRFCLKQLIQTLTEENVVHQFSTIPSKDQIPPSPSATIELLIESLIGILVDIPVSNETYALHAESITTLLALLSVQMYSIKPASKSSIYKIIMGKKFSDQSQVLMRNLLNNFLDQAPAPRDDGGSLIVGLASGFMNVLSLGYTRTEEDPDQTAVLAKLSIWLILVLTNHFTCENNPFRDAIVTCLDSRTEKVSEDSSGFRIDFNRLFVTISKVPNDDQTSLLLYILIHRNVHFRTYILSRTSDLDQIVIPILKIMYDCPEKSSHHVYMALILLLILTEDTLFNESIHDIVSMRVKDENDDSYSTFYSFQMVKNVIWYKEKILTEISLGGLMVLVVIRALQFNISRTRDKFLHTNLLATLANMSSYFKHLNPYVCQKMLTLFIRISKRFHRRQSTSSASVNGSSSSNPSVTVEVSERNGGQQIEDHESDIAVNVADASRDLTIYEEVLRMILEIINSCLASQLTHNPNLVYTLLYNRTVFEPYHDHPSFQDVVMNIETVLTYFSNRIATESGENTLSVSEVYQIIENSSKKWPSEKLKVFAPLKFKYVEDDQPEEFFIPYIWSLVYKSSFINFNSQNILLFNPNKNFL